MNKERLLTLAAHLRTLPPEKLDMTDWVCGAAACAVGHACTMPVFQQQGLRMHPDGFPVFGEYMGYGAVMNFFDLGFDDTEYLIDSGEYTENPLPITVAARIEQFVQRYGGAPDATPQATE